ncbi:MAG: hypothetical protein LBG80_12930 [Bacteroidales bacterium]|jgi:hypothetical protein|nr:hypothetical protein [Bacteroidales bacterium]
MDGTKSWKIIRMNYWIQSLKKSVRYCIWKKIFWISIMYNIKMVFFDMGGTLIYSDKKSLTEIISVHFGIKQDDILPFIDAEIRTKNGDKKELLKNFCKKIKKIR